MKTRSCRRLCVDRDDPDGNEDDDDSSKVSCMSDRGTQRTREDLSNNQNELLYLRNFSRGETYRGDRLP